MIWDSRTCCLRELLLPERCYTATALLMYNAQFGLHVLLCALRDWFRESNTAVAWTAPTCLSSASCDYSFALAHL